MLWQYLLVFLGALLFDILPFPFFPAFTIMVFIQIIFDLNVWLVILIGVFGSVSGRYVLLLYSPYIGKKFLKASKNEDIQFLGEKMKENKWKAQLIILAYSLLPLPSSAIFLGAGISKIKPIYILPAFFMGKFASDSIVVLFGKYAFENAQHIIDQALSWKFIASIVLSFFLLFCLLFIDWRFLIQNKKLAFNFRIWK